MDFDQLLDQAIEMLQRRGRLTYRTLKIQFQLSDAELEALQDELLFSKLAVDEAGRGLVWTGETAATPGRPNPPTQPEPQPVVEPTQPAHIETPPLDLRTPEAERRQLTVTFCDLVGSTALSGRLDPEDLREVIQAYQAACAPVIQRFDGHVAQHLGDGLLIYFGYPVAHEDDAQRAVRTGLSIIEAMPTLNQQLQQTSGIQLAVRVGLHTGVVVIGDIGAGARQEQLALGETPNIAARIQGLAAPDTLVMSAETHRLTQGFFECESLGAHELRGVSQPVAVYRVLGDTGMQSRFDVAGARGLTPLVGRESECALLFERWEQAKDGHGQVILVSGEAGIGKSRLVQVLRGHAADGPHARLEGRSSPYFANSALYPIIDMLQRALRFLGDDGPAQKLDKLVQYLSQYRFPLEATAPLFASLLSLPIPEDQYPPLDLTPQQQRQKILEVLIAMILDLAEREPVLFILEDLHWTDPTTLEFLDLLIDQSATAAVLMLLTCRPEFEPTQLRRTHLVEISLSRLSQAQIEAMIERVANGKHLPDEVLRELIEKTDGVPLYLEEMTKAVIESGMLTEHDDHYELMGSVASLAIPSTLHDSLMARLDRLASAKVIAQLGAVIGRQFSYELLHAVLQFNEATLQRELAGLIETELVYQRGLPPKATYTFKHALIRDTAYESLLRSTRQGYHRRIAEVLEERFPEAAETQPELLAHHYTEAGENEVAVSYWRRAGEQASARSAYIEAVAQLRKGLDVLQRLPAGAARDRRELTLQLTLAESLTVVEGYSTPTLEPIYQRAREIGIQLDEIPQLVSILQWMRRYYVMRLDLEMARQLGVELLDFAQRQDDSGALQEGHWGLGQTLYFLGDVAGARNHLTQSSAAYVPQPLTTPASREFAGTQVACLVTLGRPTWALGYPDQARAYTREGLLLAQELAHPYTLAFAHYAAALNHFFCGDAHSVLEQIDASLALGREHDFPVWIAWGAFLRGWALAMQGQIDESLAAIQGVWASYQDLIDESTRPTAFVILAEIWSLADKASEGLQAMDDILALVEKTGGRFWEAEIYRLKGVLHLAPHGPKQKIAEAEACFHTAISIAQSQHAKSWELRAAASLAKLWQSQGKRHEAYDLLAPVYGWFIEGFDTADLRDAKTLLEKLRF